MNNQEKQQEEQDQNQVAANEASKNLSEGSDDSPINIGCSPEYINDDKIALAEERDVQDIEGDDFDDDDFDQDDEDFDGDED